VSYDLRLEIDTGGVQPGVLVDLNLSHAAGSALATAAGCGVHDLDGWLAGDLIDAVRAAVNANPNMAQLWELERACRSHPKATVRIV
jgi:hypothetical protein